MIDITDQLKILLASGRVSGADARVVADAATTIERLRDEVQKTLALAAEAGRGRDEARRAFSRRRPLQP